MNMVYTSGPQPFWHHRLVPWKMGGGGGGGTGGGAQVSFACIQIPNGLWTGTSLQPGGWRPLIYTSTYVSSSVYFFNVL